MVLHCDDDDLALLALGESVGADDEAHLSTCSRCRSRLDQLSAVVTSARSVTPADHPVAPPPSVWAGITAELGTEGSGSVASLDQARERRRPRVWLVAASAAAVGLLAGAGLMTVLNATTPSDQLVATATLDPIGDSGVTGTASVEKGSQGKALTVEVPGLSAAGDGYYEVWMATADTTTMVAIGTLSPGGPATFTLPAGLDPAQFPVVDVSLEHFDGEAGHSATSVVRGQLTT
jgi:anti-sigma-K factor RskA